MNIVVLKSRIMSLALIAVVLCHGCATHESKKNAESAGMQTAADEQLIVVPVLILSPAQNGSPNGGGDVLPAPDSPDRSTRKSAPLSL